MSNTEYYCEKIKEVPLDILLCDRLNYFLFDEFGRWKSLGYRPKDCTKSLIFQHTDHLYSFEWKNEVTLRFQLTER